MDTFIDNLHYTRTTPTHPEITHLIQNNQEIYKEPMSCIFRSVVSKPLPSQANPNQDPDLWKGIVIARQGPTYHDKEGHP
jgi:hypothetical protein